jgi:hypothetical protein
MSATSGYTGDYITLIGKGFKRDGDIVIKWNNSVLSLGDVRRPSKPADAPNSVVEADEYGFFKIQVKVQRSPRGTVPLEISDGTSTVNQNFEIMPQVIFRDQSYWNAQKKDSTTAAVDNPHSHNDIRKLPSEGFVGDTAAILLTGFAKSDSVTLSIGGQTIATVAVNDKGYGLTTRPYQ